MFKDMIKVMNESLVSSDKTKVSTDNYIGILDIAGFESFEVNSLEQLFINLSNETLQQYFNNYVFKSELDDYRAEDVPVDQIRVGVVIRSIRIYSKGVMCHLKTCGGARPVDESLER